MNCCSARRTAAVRELNRLMLSMSADILILSETHWDRTRAQGVARDLRANSNAELYYSCKEDADSSPRRGVAVILSQRLAIHARSQQTQTHSVDGVQRGTLLKLTLNFRRTVLQIIAAYIPPKSTSDPRGVFAASVRNQALVWLREAREAGDAVLMGGDLNEHLWLDESHSELGRYLHTSAWLTEAWIAAHQDRVGGETYPQRDPKYRLDYLYYTAQTVGQTAQAVRSRVKSDIGEDHCGQWFDILPVLGNRGPAQTPPQRQPRLATAQASKDDWAAFAESLKETPLDADKPLGEQLYKRARASIPSRTALKSRARRAAPITRASLARRIIVVEASSQLA
ncbi:hypothetical protein FBU59_000482 [Linderina macrospora]|uniref:Uncharacterized protein n=1 Tax=Linderina macrospora TaxID=4868 RepID=A0ACC1JH23_9FUNG|nr:hypothetical protein FBU59_000482 [Linderina macrospora]